MMFSDECQEIENHLKSLLLMGSKTTDSSLTRETTVYENSCYPHENQRLVFRAERRNNTIFKNDHTQNLQRTSENKKQRRKFQSDFVDPRDRRSTAETRRLFSGGQNAFTGEQKREHFNSNYNNKRRQRNHRKQSDVKSEHNQCNSFYSTEFLSRVSDKDVHASAENDADFEPELFYPKYSPKSKAKESNKKSRNYFKSDNVPRTFVPQKSQAASFKDNSDQGVRTDSVNLVKERRTQANIFRNALVKTRCNETKKDELHKSPVDSKESLTENAIPCKNDLPSEVNTVLTADDQACGSPTKTSSPEVVSDAQCKNETTNQSAKMPDLSVKGKLDLPSPNFLKVKAKYEALKANPQDNFITSCTKPNCNCSANVIYCTLCDFHIENEKELTKHKKNISHQLRREDFYRVQYLKELPPPTETQFQKMEELFDKIYKHYSQEYEDVNIRFSVVDKLKLVLKDVTKECEIHLFGSSVNGFGLKDSNLNIDLAVPQGISPSRVLLNTYDIIKEREDKYINVWKDFTAAVPKITFLDRQTNLTCEITLNNEFSGKTSRLFAHYAYCDERVRKLGIIFRFWAKVCEIDQQQICSLPSYCYPLMVIFFLQQHDPPVIPVLHELTDFDGDDSGNVFQKTSWKSVNNQSVAQLWMELLKFYGTKFLFKHHVISVCQLKPLLCTEKKWTTRMMCIEDPYHKKRNVARSIANHQWFHYIVECIRSTYEYFITCRSPSDQSLIENEVFEDDEDEDDEDDDEDIDFVSSDDICEKFEEEQDSALNTDTVKTILSRLNLGNNAEDALKYRIPGSSDLHDNSNLQTLNTSENNQSTFLYKFDVSNFITLKKPTLYCRQCQKTGHYKQNCTIDENLPELRPLPKMDEQHKLLLTEICEVIFNLWKLSPKVQEENKTLLYSLQKHIQCRFLDAKLELFGSSCNGFGFIDSDLDICLTFENNSGEALNQQHIIESLTAELKKYKKIQDILPIPTAKVPIIKFSFKHTNKEGDISVYNTLGQHNTRLLLTYSKIDPRVQKLGYVLKYFAKICDICDASRGSLSSYAYILMVLYFLQQRDPPVIPVLQELYDTSKPKPVRNVDGCNTWFFEDIHNLEDVWPQSKKNTETLGELWLGLLRFYTEKFRVNELVICIRQKAPLTRFEKLWNTKSIAIEDPFDHNHNLGAGVSRKMNAFIFAAFRRGREHFGRTPPNRRDLPNILDYFFNGKLFTDGKNPPNERGCRICNKIGHKMKDCPLKRTDKFRHKQFFGSKRKTNSENQLQKSQEKNFSYNERNMNKSIHKDAHWNNTTNTNFQQSRGFSQNSAIGGNIPQNFQQFKPTNVRQDTRIVSRFQQRDFNK